MTMEQIEQKNVSNWLEKKDQEKKICLVLYQQPLSQQCTAKEIETPTSSRLVANSLSNAKEALLQRYRRPFWVRQHSVNTFDTASEAVPKERSEKDGDNTC